MSIRDEILNKARKDLGDDAHEVVDAIFGDDESEKLFEEGYKTVLDTICENNTIDDIQNSNDDEFEGLVEAYTTIMHWIVEVYMDRIRSSK